MPECNSSPPPYIILAFFPITILSVNFFKLFNILPTTIIYQFAFLLCPSKIFYKISVGERKEQQKQKKSTLALLKKLSQNNIVFSFFLTSLDRTALF